MAESMVNVGDDSERNFILAKLVSLFGDSVEFDVINIVAQENEWNEEKCIKSLKVLGDYINPETTPFTRDIIENVTSDSQKGEASPVPEFQRVVKKKKPGPSAVVSNLPRQKMSGSHVGNAQLGLAGVKHNSPSKAIVHRPKERSTESQEHHDKVKTLIESGTPVLIMLRGLPGSGKTTLAKNLLALPGAKKGCTYSADNFFLVHRGGKGEMEYHYDPLRIAEAHEWNRVQVLRAIAHGVTPIIVDNTNIQTWEMLPYIEMVLEPWKAEESLRRMTTNGSIPKNNICGSFGAARKSFIGKRCPCGYTVMETSNVPYQVELLEPLTWWYQNPSRLAKVNQHGVSQKKISQMLSHFEFGVTGKTLIKLIRKKKQTSVTIPPGLMNVRTAVQEKKLPGHFAGPPLFNMNPMINPGSEFGSKPRTQNIPGNNTFKHHSVNQFQNPIELSSGPYPRYFGSVPNPQGMRININPFSVSTASSSSAVSSSSASANQNTMTKNTVPENWALGDQLCEMRKEDSLNQSSNHRPALSNSTSTSSSSFMENQHSIVSSVESTDSNKGNQSSNLSTMEPNPFDKSLNSPNKSTKTSSFLESECVEMSEEDLQEWMEANASRWDNWESSDEDSENECEENSNEPKPARPPKQRHRDCSPEKTENENGLAGEISTTSMESLDGEFEKETEKIPEWVVEEVDPLTSWNAPNSSSDDCKELKTQVPLPPRFSKKKRLVEGSTKLVGSVKTPEKVCNDVDQIQSGLIEQLQCLLGEYGVRNKELNSCVQTRDDSINYMKSASNVDYPEMVSKIQVHKELSLESEQRYDVEISTVLESDDVIISKTSSVAMVDVKEEDTVSSFPNATKATDLQIGMVDNNGSWLSAAVTQTNGSDSFVKTSKDNPKNVEEALKRKIDDPLHSASSKVPADLEMESSTSGATLSKQSKEASLKENDAENHANTVSRDTEEQNIKIRMKYFESLALVTDEGFKLHDNTLQRVRSIDENDEAKNPENHETVIKTELQEFMTSYRGGPEVLDNMMYKPQPSITVNDHFEQPEALKLSTAEAVPAKLRTNIDINITKSSEVSEKDNDPEALESGVISLIEVHKEVEGGKDSLLVAQTTTTVQRDKEHEITTSTHYQEPESQGRKLNHLESSVSLENNIRGSENGKDREAKVLDAPTPSDPSLVSFKYVSPKRSCLEKLQESFKVNSVKLDSSILPQDALVHETPLEERNVEKDHDGVVSISEKVKLHFSGGDVCGLSLETCAITSCSPRNEITTETKDKRPGPGMESAEDNQTEEWISKITALSFHDALENILGLQENESPSSGNCKSDNEESSVTVLALPEQNIDVEKVKTLIMGLDEGEHNENEEFPTNFSVVATEGSSAMEFCGDKNTFPLVLDPSFLEQICQKFGNPYQESMDEPLRLPSSQGNTHKSGVTIHVPTSLAKKLHECWLKSQWDAILDDDEISQKMIQEDEMLARQLQEFEKEDMKEKKKQSEPSSSTTPNLREIMDMEMAMAMYKAEQGKKMQLNHRNDISTRLSWDLLTKEFPQLQQEIISQIFSAYNYSYTNTREALLSSLPDNERDFHEEAVKDVVSPEVLAAQEKMLIEKAKLESLKVREFGKKYTYNNVTNGTLLEQAIQRHVQFQNPELQVEIEEKDKEVEGSWEAMVDQARKSAALNRRLQRERHAQAQAANRNGIPSAAAYYCRMATLHKQKAEEANRRAANILSKVFTGEYSSLKGITIENDTISPPPSTLDMHSMSVLEALRVMNAFLDAHAEWLRTEKSKPNAELTRKNSPVKMATLFLITGRGMNSQGGIPRIKPAVERQLEKRGVWYEELNPGLLRVMVSANLTPAKKM